jgi:hypothetical protein
MYVYSTVLRCYTSFNNLSDFYHYNTGKFSAASPNYTLCKRGMRSSPAYNSVFTNLFVFFFLSDMEDISKGSFLDMIPFALLIHSNVA